MRASLLILVTCGLGACADLETFDFEMVLPDDAAVMRAAAVAPPAPLVALAPEVTLVATEGVTSPAWGRAARRHLGEAPGLFGDVVAGPVTAERSQQAALPVLKAIGKQVGFHVFASTRMAESTAATIVVDLPSTTTAADTLIHHVCVEAGVFCYYAGELAALSVYVPLEYRPAHAVVVAAGAGTAGVE